eukprot:TRINITY_DN3929_c0_g1_i1.p1 TRINITY_DN3929_c0_g1~~TRINITY_DN3929_c0_g1_i1.p1  ORF type:complete len:302 (-),score=95.74 TRINITY_DN3929_c0_g1_i1:188-1093(-)
MGQKPTKIMKILLSNDDGFDAPGLIAILREIVKSGHSVKVVAPSENRSAVSHCLTLHSPLKVTSFRYTTEMLSALGIPTDVDLSQIQAWKVGGTPADCAQFALLHLFGGKNPKEPNWFPDLVLSGINRGNNAGYNVIYSGTVAAAMEGSVQGVPGIALSLNHPPDYPTGTQAWPYDLAANLSLEVVERLIKTFPKISKTTLWNVNIPNVGSKEEVKGVKVTKQGGWTFSEYFESIEEVNENETVYLRHGSVIPDIHFSTSDYDTVALDEGWITITPISHFLDRVDNSDIKTVKTAFPDPKQ